MRQNGVSRTSPLIGHLDLPISWASERWLMPWTMDDEVDFRAHMARLLYLHGLESRFLALQREFFNTRTHDILCDYFCVLNVQQEIRSSFPVE